MALIYCSECGTEMSDQAYACPKCGHPVPQLAPLKPMAITPSTPFYFSTPFIILSLLFCGPVGVLLMWVGRVWTSAIRAAVTAVWLFLMLVPFLMFFYAFNKSTERAGKQFDMMMEEIHKIPPPPNHFPEEYYENIERDGSSQYDYYEQEPAQLTPAKKSVQLTVEHWTWSNQASPPALKIEGTVRNNASNMFQNLKVYVTAEDADKNLLGVGSAQLDPPVLKAGGVSNFVVVINGAQCKTKELKPEFRIEY